MIKSLLPFVLFLFMLPAHSQVGAGDCPGLVVCTDQASSTVQSGSVNEINASNRGCLAASEATGSYWFNVCIGTSGTLAFIIDPSGTNNDYDFAVYGPNAPCPPTSPPIRCSYDATPVGGPNNDQTGLASNNPYNGNPEFDTSEGATGGDGFVIPINGITGECYLISINNYAGGSNTFSLDFTGSAVLICSMVPIELTQFNVNNFGGLASLTWTTATETNNDYFVIERSSTGGVFDSIGVIDGAGTSSTLRNYSFIDETSFLGIMYYRLRQVDFDRHSEVSNIVSLLLSEDESPITLHVFDISGKLVHSVATTYGERKKILDKLNLPKGLYALQSINYKGEILGTEKLYHDSSEQE